jgi:type 2A phosphatase activator TIP41
MKHADIPGGVSIGGWECTSLKTHISPSDEIDTLSRELNFVAPEQLYLSNSLKFKYTAPAYSLEFRFAASDALKKCSSDDWTFQPKDYTGKLVLTTFSNNAHNANGTGEAKADSEQQIEVDLNGAVEADLPVRVVNPVTDPKVQIDMDLLKRRDPILWYDSVVLYEDELHDHGHCTVSATTVRFRRLWIWVFF